MNQVSESRGRWAGPRRGLLGAVATLATVAGSLVVAQPASAAVITSLAATSTPKTTGVGRALTIAWTPTPNAGADPTDALSYLAEADGPDANTTADSSCFLTTNLAGTCDIPDLLAGTQYTVTVTARTAVGGGGTALAAGTVTVAPGASTTPVLPVASTPTAAATGVSGEVEVTMGAVPTAGADLVNLTATAYLGASSTGKTCSTADGIARTCKISGLTNGVAHTVKVVANGVNAAGTPLASTASNAVTPGVTVGPPTGVTAYATGTTTATVLWTAPTTAGVTLASYTVAGYTSAGVAAGTACAGAVVVAPLTRCDVTGLTVNLPYYFTVTATSTDGQTSTAANSALVIPTTPPSPPTNGNAVAGDAQATVSWLAPTSTPATIGSYRVTAYTAAAVATQYTCTTTGLSCAVTGLTNGTSYNFKVAAVGTTGSGTESTALAVSAVTPTAAGKPVTPTTVTATPTDTTAVVAWATPAANPTVPVLFYTATASPGGKACATVSGAVYTCTIIGLTPETAYTVSVVAKGATADSVAATATATTTAATPEPGDPGAPGDATGPIVVNKDGKAQMFARGGGSTAKLWTAVQNSTTGAWESWTDLGGPIYSDPVAVANTDGTLQVFVLDGSGYVTYKLQSSTTATTFGAWTRISMTTSVANIDVATNANGKVVVFGRSGEHLVYSAQTTGPDAWSSWIDLGWPISGAPSVVAMGDGKLEVFVSGYQGAIYRRAQKVVNVNASDADWTAWEKVAPAASAASFM